MVSIIGVSRYKSISIDCASRMNIRQVKRLKIHQQLDIIALRLDFIIRRLMLTFHSAPPSPSSRESRLQLSQTGGSLSRSSATC